MCRKETIDDVASSLSPPAGWAEVLEQGLEDVRHGHVVPVSDVIADIDAVLKERPY